MAEVLFYAALTGAVLGVFYDVMRFLRLIFSSKFAVDFLFWIVSAFAVFSFFLIFSNGEIRAVYLLFIFLGCILYIFTLGYVTGNIENKIAKKVKIRLKKVKNRLKSFKKVLHYVNILYYNTKEKVLKSSTKHNIGDNDEEKNRG